MRRLLSLLVCTGCNQWFGLTGTQLVPDPDAQFFDAPGPGLRECPPIGTVPQFMATFHPVAMACFGLTATQDGSRATIGCPVTDGPKIFEGALDGPFVLVPSLDVALPMHRDWPRLAPDGELFARDWNVNTTSSTLHAFVRTADSYVSDYVVSGLAFDSFAQFGTPSRGPTRRMFARPQQSLVEIAIAQDGSATVVRTYTPASLGFADTYSVPNLSPDGLRAVLQARVDPQGAAAIYYIDRPNIDAPWNPPSLVFNVGGSTETFMTADCGRLYFLTGGMQVYAEAQ